MRTITNDELKAAALEYYDAGKLTAQTSGICVLMDGNGCRCAIGASLSDEEAKRAFITNASFVGQLFSKGVVKFEDKSFAMRVQSSHDEWCGRANRARRIPESEYAFHEASRAEMKFLTILGRVPDA